MDHSGNITYLTCPQHKSRQRKHIDVCRQCEWRIECEPYQDYCASLPPAESKDPLPASGTPLIPESLARYIQSELDEIIALLEGNALTESTSPPFPKTDPLKDNDAFKSIIQELEEIKRLCPA
ncbi:hypothetical protein ACFL7E_05535 [Thermodesulfobacteriota bacterium]